MNNYYYCSKCGNEVRIGTMTCPVCFSNAFTSNPEFHNKLTELFQKTGCSKCKSLNSCYETLARESKTPEELYQKFKKCTCTS